MRLAIAGAGAVGSLLAARLIDAGHDVAVIARGRRREELQTRGIRLFDEGEVKSVHPRLITDSLPPDVSAVFLCVKAYHLEGLLPRIAAHMSPRASLVPVVNGVPWWFLAGGASPRPVAAVDPDGTLFAATASLPIVGAVAYVMASLDSEGILRSSPRARLLFGDAAETAAGSTADAIAGLFENTAIVAEAVPDIRREVWTKLLGNISSNPLSVIVEAGLRTLYTDDALGSLVRELMAEASSVAHAYGVEIAKPFEALLQTGAAAGDFRTSMLQDYLGGRALELAAICDAVIELADAMGVEVPVLRTVTALTGFKAAQRPPL